MFATSKGFIVPSRPAGSATIHTNEIIHGVTALRSGVRYGLFFCDTKGSQANCDSGPMDMDVQEEAKEMVQFLVPNALKQLQFYKRAVDILMGLSDTELYDCQSRYAHDYMRRRSAPDDTSFGDDLSFACEVLHHVHMLHPQLYSKALLSASLSSADAVDNLGIDLVAKSRKQLSFMQDLIDLEEEGCCSEEALRAACGEYLAYMSSLEASNGHNAVPSALVDHIWHTHMCFPERYSLDCLKLCGFEVDHLIL